ncbi:DUF2637 domain-containing protein [Streptomyces sp. AJS327]|uniref:DUF2637 domain-containing protein n=1 Tax=Streptomyces sp. AJS327 TaxID=2545265 RepID=UPI0015DD6E09|nr:DUF2637 domain-containing protein [Streptomyces sp. AJS327]MBA0054328.1 DUF2637 domain-containing protein [Streptomyces sp. AJS327]
MDTHKAERAALYVAVGVIIALTAGAFWLSYAHLADVAGTYGLGSSPVRRWAWPGTLDLFIVAGEVLMFRAALRQQTDPWAIGLTVAGSLGSIALNVAGVGTQAATLDYVVAAVPPTAALLAFGALMRQVHVMVTAPAKAKAPAPGVVAMDAPAQNAQYVVAQRNEEPAERMATLDDQPDTEADTTPDTELEGVATDADSADTEPDTTKETDDAPDNVVDMVKPSPRKAASRGRTLEEILAAVRFLEDSGQSVNGTTYAAHVGGISTRTGRRDLSRVGITTAA